MSAHELRRVVDVAVETIAVNREQHLLLFNPSDEIDSLAEHIIALRHHGVPGAVISGLLREVSDVADMSWPTADIFVERVRPAARPERRFTGAEAGFLVCAVLLTVGWLVFLGLCAWLVLG